MQQSFETIYLDASSESWEQSNESVPPGASFGDLLDIYGNQRRSALRPEEASPNAQPEIDPKLR
jgi:hypothetical protein